MTVEAEPARPGPVWRAALAYQRFADRVSEWMGELAQWVVIPTVVVGFGNVILRYLGRFAGRSLTNNGLIEAQWYLYSLIFLLGFGYVLKHQINVRVDFWFGHQPRRRKVWIDLVGHTIALLPFVAIGIWVSYPQVVTSWRLDEQSPDAGGLPRAPIKTMIIVAFVLLGIQAVAEAIKLVAVLSGHESDVHLEEPPEHVRVE